MVDSCVTRGYPIPMVKEGQAPRRSLHRSLPWGVFYRRVMLAAAALGVSEEEIYRRAGRKRDSVGHRLRHHPCAPPAYVKEMAAAVGVSPRVFCGDEVVFVMALRGKAPARIDVPV